MRFRTALLLGPLVFITGIAAAAAAAVSAIMERSAREDVIEDLSRSVAVFDELQRYRQSMLRIQASVLADEPRIRALLATAEISSETMSDVARDLSRALEADVFMLINDTGKVVVESAGVGASEIQADRLVSEALESGESFGTWLAGDKVYQLQAVRVAMGDDTLGAILLGYVLDEIIVQALYRLTASSVIIEHSARAIAISPIDGSFRSVDSMVKALARVPTGGHEPTLVVEDGARHLALAARLPGHHDDDHALRYVVLKSLDRALAPGSAMERVLMVSVIVALLLAFALSMVLSRLLARPIDRLVAFTRHIAGGDLRARAEVTGTTDLRVLADAMNHMAERVEASQRQLAARQRLEKEMELAAQIQVAMLPRELEVPGLDLGARMLPATEVGGDYYDILPREHCWLAIGDVAGHGVPAGLVMMMVQNVLAAIVDNRPDATPSQVCCEVNRVLTHNVRQRLRRDEHVTLTLLRYEHSGRVLFAGAHEDLVVWRARTGKCERIQTTGTWLAVIPDIEPFTRDHELTLDPGDVLVLYTDGITEAMSPSGEQFGMDRLCAAVQHKAGGAVNSLCDHILREVQAFAAAQTDDITVLAVRRL